MNRKNTFSRNKDGYWSQFTNGNIRQAFMMAFTMLVTMLTLGSVAQQVCCPDFILKDAIEICPPEGQCQGGTAPNGHGSMAACKLSIHTYTVYPNTAPYTYSWTVTGGTPASPTGNPMAITWGSGSTGFIKVVISGGGCLDSISQPICLIDGPKANFTAAPNPVCSGSPVHFVNTSTGGGGYLWDFGDGTTSTLANPPDHVYLVAANYTVTLTATDMGAPKQGTDIRTPCGCVSTYSKVIQVLSGAGPTIETTCCYGTRCPGDTSSFCTPLVCGTYNWIVANGIIISGAGTNCIKVKWNAVYTVPPTVSLSVPGCVAAPCPGTTTLHVPVLYPNLPITGPNPLCVGTAGSFFLPSMPGTYYTWTTTAAAGTSTFNDKDRNVANVNMTFNVPGTYQIICNYNNPFAGCSGTSIFTINVLPVFSISGNDKACQYATESYFGSGNATWTVTGPAAVTPVPAFGNPTSITYNVPGTYTITATPPPGIYCNVNAVKVVQIVAVPILNPITGPTLVCPNKNEVYSVSSNTTGSPFAWSVISGTGTVQTQFGPDQNTAIIKLTGGPSWTIQVVQQIELSPGVFCTSLPQTLVVNKYGPPVFTPAPPATVCVDAVTSFTVTGPTPVQWIVTPANRGSIISGQGMNTVNIRWHGPPTTATVTASNCGGFVSTNVTIVNPPAISGITANGPKYYCLPAMPSGLVLTTNAGPYTYVWTGPPGFVPPGNTNTAPVPNSVFSPVPGSFTFTVTVSNGICSVTKSITIVIAAPPCDGGGGGDPPCTVDFTISPNPVCVDQPATFTIVPNGSGWSYQWAFGDGSTSFETPTQHTYIVPNTYNVTVTATLGTCVTTKVHSIIVNPTPTCTITAPDTMYCPGSSVWLYGCAANSYQWFKDGASISGATNMNYSANQYGDYWVEVSNVYLCYNTSNHIFIYEKALPTAKITGDGLVCGYGGGVASFQLSAFYNANYSYSWSSNPTGATFSPNNSNASFYTTASITLPAVLPYTCAFIVKVTDTVTGCINHDTLCITFYQTPPLSFNFYSGCEGTPFTLAPITPPINPALYHYQWSNGKTTPTITVSVAGNYSLTITDKVSGCSATALAGMIHPLPDLSLFPHGCDSICSTDTLHLYIPLPLNAVAPFNTYPSAYPLIKWIDNGVYATPIGYGQYLNFNTAVPGNHQISIVVGTVYGCTDTAGVFCLNVRNCPPNLGLDFGDAPDNPAGGYNYQTLLPNGARHTIVPGVFMGTKIDAEPNGQPNIPANGDDINGLADEDGVTMPSVIQIGSTYSITVTTSVPGYLDAWIDYGIAGNWIAPIDHVFSSAPVPGVLTFTVPTTATMGQSYARFRFRTTSGAISYNGLVADGEVEDYPVFINKCCQGDTLDYGDAPDLPTLGYNYPTLLSSNGARHVVCSNIRLGALIDGEANGQPNALALGDDQAGLPDEDGVQFVGTMYVGMPASIKVTASISGFLNAWMDFNKDGDWADAGEQIFVDQPLVAGVNNLTFNIPATAVQGNTFMRFRFNTLGGLTYYGLATNGEVEDYRVHDCPYWWPVHTNLKHYITIPHNLSRLHPGDVLGVFYHDASGMLACGGLSEFNGTDDQMMIAYGDNPATPVKDGFVVGEPIYWKLCSVVKGDANPIDVTYDFTYPSSNGLFTQNGLSALSDIIGLNMTAGATPISICSGDPVELYANAGPGEGIAYNWTSLPEGFTSDVQYTVDHPAVNTTYYVHAFDGVFDAYDTVKVAVTQVNPLVDILPLKDVTIPSGQGNCYNAIQTIAVAGNGSTFLVESGGSAQFVAGQNVRFLPGTKGNLGSYLHAYTTATGPYCCNVVAPVKDATVVESATILTDGNKPFYKVYPNPTTGTFTFELNNVEESSKVTVEIYGILGERILKKELSGMKQQVFDLSGRQHGVYLIRVLNGAEMGITKIIKQ